MAPATNNSPGAILEFACINYFLVPGALTTAVVERFSLLVAQK